MRPVVQYWHSPERPGYICKEIKSFARLNPGRPHLIFDENSAEEFIAERFGPGELAAFRACGPPAMQSDYLRCCAILEYGGVWADASLTCVSKLDSLLLESTEGTLFEWRSPYYNTVLMNSLFAFPTPGHPFLRLTLDAATRLIEIRWRGLVNEVTGPVLMTAIHGLGHTGSREAFLKLVENDCRLPDRHVRHAEAVADAVGDPMRAIEACADLSVLPPGAFRKWALASGADLPHRASGEYWPRQGTDIYVDQH